MPARPYLAEFLGTFTLALFVSMSVVDAPRFSAVFVAPVVVGLFVYTIGWLSGAHLNPAVTIGLASIKKITVPEAVYYVLAQMLGAIAAMIVSGQLLGAGSTVVVGDSIRIVVGEAMGAFLLVWAIMAVVERKAHVATSGLLIGSGLLLGILLAATVGTNGVLNPAVAVAIGSLSFSYLLGPVIGGVAAAWAYRALAEPSPASQPVH